MKNFDAKKAREIADAAYSEINTIMAAIKNEAEQGKNILSVSYLLKIETIKTLEAKRFKVILQTPMCIIKKGIYFEISW